MELQSFDDGTVAKLAAAQGQTVPVGTVIMVLATKGEDISAIKASGPATAAVEPKATATPRAAKESGPVDAPGRATTTVVEAPNGHGSRVFASPLAKKIADEAGVDLGGIAGSGPGGRIIRRDVEDGIDNGPGPGGA